MGKAVIVMGSKSDLAWSKRIKETLEKFGVESVLRVASAHKVPLRCYDLVKEYERENVVFITVAGRSDALSGFTDSQTFCPVIACPPYSEKFGGMDLLSSLRMPSGVAPMVVIEPEKAALAAAKILGLVDGKIQDRVKEHQEGMKKSLEEDDSEVREE